MRRGAHLLAECWEWDAEEKKLLQIQVQEGPELGRP